MEYKNIKVGPLFHVVFLLLSSLIVLPSIYDLFFKMNEDVGFLFILSIPAMFIFSMLSLLFRPQYLAWQAREKGWWFLILNAVMVEALSLGSTYLWLVSL